MPLAERSTGHAFQAVSLPKMPTAVRRRPRPAVARGLLVLFAGVYLVLAAVLFSQDALQPALLSLSFAVWAVVLREEPAAGLPLFLLMAGLDVTVLNGTRWAATWTGEVGPLEFGLLLKAALLTAALAWSAARKCRRWQR
jgi:hypothetical protein